MIETIVLNVKVNNMKNILLIVFALSFCFPAFSAEKTYKDWFFRTDGEDFYYAVTVNNNNHIFGEYCYIEDQECLFLIGVGIACTEGDKYPVLVNTESGSVYLNLVCGNRIGKQNVLIFDDFEQIESVVKASKQFKIAIPIKDSQFKVSRFSLSGSTYSLDVLSKEIEKRVLSPNVDSALL